MQYCVSRGDRPRPDRGELRRRLRPDRPRRRSCSPTCASGPGTASQPPEPAWPETDGPQIIALAHAATPQTGTVTLILDATTASTVIFAVAAHADEREAHVREVERFGPDLARRLLRPAQPPGHRRPRNPRRRPAARRRARLPGRHRARYHATSRPSPIGAPHSPANRWPTGKSSWNSERAHRPADRADSDWIRPVSRPPFKRDSPRTHGPGEAQAEGADPLGN